jgi:hypothetical protein
MKIKILSFIKDKNVQTLILINGILLFFLTYITCVSLQVDGYSLSEVVFLTLLPGVYCFVLVLATYPYFINKHRKSIYSNSLPSIHKFFQVFMVFVLSTLFYFVIDILIFNVDKTISYDFAISLLKIPSENNLQSHEIEEYANEPFSIQTGMITFSIGFIAVLLSLLFIKKDGGLLKYKY